MSLSPFFKSPFTDLTGDIVSHQWFGRCADFENNALNCMEAYGLDRGRKECEVLIRDYKECTLRTKQFLRFQEMVLERDRQYKAGERSKENKYAPTPKPDAF